MKVEKICNSCNGKGRKTIYNWKGEMSIGECHVCKGRGKILVCDWRGGPVGNTNFRTCYGTGRVMVAVNEPKDDGQVSLFEKDE